MTFGVTSFPIFVSGGGRANLLGCKTKDSVFLLMLVEGLFFFAKYFKIWVEIEQFQKNSFSFLFNKMSNYSKLTNSTFFQFCLIMACFIQILELTNLPLTWWLFFTTVNIILIVLGLNKISI